MNARRISGGGGGVDAGGVAASAHTSAGGSASGSHPRRSPSPDLVRDVVSAFAANAGYGSRFNIFTDDTGDDGDDGVGDSDDGPGGYDDGVSGEDDDGADQIDLRGSASPRDGGESPDVQHPGHDNVERTGRGVADNNRVSGAFQPPRGRGFSDGSSGSRGRGNLPSHTRSDRDTLGQQVAAHAQDFLEGSSTRPRDDGGDRFTSRHSRPTTDSDVQSEKGADGARDRVYDRYNGGAVGPKDVVVAARALSSGAGAGGGGDGAGAGAGVGAVAATSGDEPVHAYDAVKDDVGFSPASPPVLSPDAKYTPPRASAGGSSRYGNGMAAARRSQGESPMRPASSLGEVKEEAQSELGFHLVTRELLQDTLQKYTVKYRIRKSWKERLFTIVVRSGLTCVRASCAWCGFVRQITHPCFLRCVSLLLLYLHTVIS